MLIFADRRFLPLLCLIYLHECTEVSCRNITTTSPVRPENTILSVLTSRQIRKIKSGSKDNNYSSKEQQIDQGHWDLPENVNETCQLKVDQQSVGYFRRAVLLGNAIFIYLDLQPEADISIYGSDDIVEKNTWVWTFYGKGGGLEFLRWPTEYGIWSMGFLYSYVEKRPQPMLLSRAGGNCSNLRIGTRNGDTAISKALLRLPLEVSDHNEQKYAASFFCYKRRHYIQHEFVYVLCKYIVCPLAALKYVCCSNVYNVSTRNRSIECFFNKNHTFYYDYLSWIFPTLISVLVFAYCPLFLLYLAQVFVCGNQTRRTNILQNLPDDMDEEDMIDLEDIVFLDGHPHVTLTQTLASPFRKCCLNVHSRSSETGRSFLKRAVRLLIPFLSLSVIGLQICLDYFNLYHFVLESVQKGVPMGFRSALAGYDLSKDNFLQYLGGPFVAVGIYVCLTCFMIMLPSSVSELLLMGVQGQNINESWTPLCLNLRNVERFGSVKTCHTSGFQKLYKVLISQIFMLINSKFWDHAMTVQVERWNRIYIRRGMLIVLPIYFVVCIFEHIACILLYGFPVMSFGLVILKALYSRIAQRRPPTKMFNFVCTVLVTVSVAFLLFMTGTILMDTCLFCTRVAIFTFTGIVVYPKVSYGYIIFAFTVIYYIWQCFRDFSEIYYRLLKDVLSISESLQRSNDTERLVVVVGDMKGVQISLFEHVIEIHCPRRKQAFVSVLKGTVVLTVLGLLINILTETDGFQELHVVMHVGTALFVCALPQIIKSMCRRLDTKFRQRRFQRELRKTIKDFNGYYSLNVQTELTE